MSSDLAATFKSVWSVQYERNYNSIVKQYFSTEGLASEFAAEIGHQQMSNGFMRPKAQREIAVFVGGEVIPMGKPVNLIERDWVGESLVSSSNVFPSLNVFPSSNVSPSSTLTLTNVERAVRDGTVQEDVSKPF
jgi:hypothetical protein